MPRTRNGTKRPREPLLYLSAESGQRMCRIGGRLRMVDASQSGVAVEIPPFRCLGSNSGRGHRLEGSLTGVVASKKVTEASQGPLSTNGNRAESVLAQAGLTGRQTSRSGGKPGQSDPVVRHGTAIAQRIKGTPGITG